MTKTGDIHGLIKALQSNDADIRTRAAQSLGSLGQASIDPLIRTIRTKNKTLKLGVISALAGTKDPRSGIPLIAALSDESSEVRWQTAIALSEIGGDAVISALYNALKDEDKYVRFGAAISLAKLGWKPKDPTERAYYFAGMQEWLAVKNIGKPAVHALTGLLKDPDRTVRIKAIEILGSIGDSEAVPALMQSLQDSDQEVRWSTVLAASKCGVSHMHLPRGISKRPLNTKNPWIAGFLNFLLPGTGYAYLGKWWGALIFSFDELVTLWIFKMEGDNNTFALIFPVYLILGIHAWYMASKIPEDPP